MKTSATCTRAECRGFTLIELLVVIAIIALLAGLLLPTLARSKQKAAGIQCLSNGRQLTLAWKMYVDDNSEKLPISGGRRVDPENWVNGWLDADGNNRSNWDIETDIKKGLLWQYSGQNPGIYKCPADHSSVRVAGIMRPRVRSVSMNDWFNRQTENGMVDIADVMVGIGFRRYRKLNDLIDPGPTSTFLFIDERNDSMDDGRFFVRMIGYPNMPGLWRIINYPASYHGNAGGLSFADGHAEIRRWRDPRTMPPLDPGLQRRLNIPSPNNQDCLWLMERSTRSITAP